MAIKGQRKSMLNSILRVASNLLILGLEGKSLAALSQANPPSFLKLLHHYPSEQNLDVNPGYYSSQNLTTNQPLQTCLSEELLVNNRMGRHGKDFGLVLIDLSGDKLLNPQFAHYNSDVAMYGASQSKAGALLGAHQLLYDLKQLAKELAKSNDPSLAKLEAEVKARYEAENPKFRLKELFQLGETSKGIAVAFSPKFAETLDLMIRMSNNDMASKVIKDVGFNYINSVLWQTGIYDVARGGGLWVGRAYAGGEMWHRDPVANQSHAITPLSMAKYMTLAAQDRLVSKEESQSIKKFLANTNFHIKFVKGLENLGLAVNEKRPEIKDPVKRALILRKSGSMNAPNAVSHDATIIYRTACVDKPCSKKIDLTYVATGASRGKATDDMPQFLVSMDKCIRKNNGIETKF